METTIKGLGCLGLRVYGLRFRIQAPFSET